MNAYEHLKQLRKEESKLAIGCATSEERYAQWQAKLREVEQANAELATEVLFALAPIKTFESLAIIKPAVDLLKRTARTNLWSASEEQKAVAREAQAKTKAAVKLFNMKLNALWKQYSK